MPEKTTKQEPLRAVYIYVNRTTSAPHSYRVTLRPGQYRVNSYGQYVLPDGFYSAGWMDRVWDIQWQELSPIPSHRFPSRLTYSKCA